MFLAVRGYISLKLFQNCITQKTITAMKFFVLLLVIWYVFFGETLNADSITSVAEKVDPYCKKIQILAKEKNISEIKFALSEIDTIFQKESNNAVKCLCWARVLGIIMGHLQSDDLFQTGIDIYLDKVVALDIESLDSKFEQIALLRTLLCPAQLLHPLDENTETKRAKRVFRLIELVMEIYKFYDPNWNPDDPKNIVVSESRIYTFISSDPMMRPNPKTQPEEAAMYERFSRNVAEYWKKYNEQERLKNFPKYFNITNENIVKAYSTGTRDDEGLIRLLEKSNYPVEEQIKVLAALEIPYKGFRQWQSTDGLFKTTAKFISSEKGEVTLEKADGKQTTIELSALRAEDQEYVKEQNNVK